MFRYNNVSRTLRQRSQLFLKTIRNMDDLREIKCEQYIAVRRKCSLLHNCYSVNKSESRTINNNVNSIFIIIVTLVLLELNTFTLAFTVSTSHPSDSLTSNISGQKHERYKHIDRFPEHNLDSYISPYSHTLFRGVPRQNFHGSFNSSELYPLPYLSSSISTLITSYTEQTSPISSIKFQEHFNSSQVHASPYSPSSVSTQIATYPDQAYPISLLSMDRSFRQILPQVPSVLRPNEEAAMRHKTHQRLSSEFDDGNMVIGNSGERHSVERGAIMGIKNNKYGNERGDIRRVRRRKGAIVKIVERSKKSDSGLDAINTSEKIIPSREDSTWASKRRRESASKNKNRRMHVASRDKNNTSTSGRKISVNDKPPYKSAPTGQVQAVRLNVVEENPALDIGKAAYFPKNRIYPNFINFDCQINVWEVAGNLFSVKLSLRYLLGI